MNSRIIKTSQENIQGKIEKKMKRHEQRKKKRALRQKFTAANDVVATTTVRPISNK